MRRIALSTPGVFAGFVMVTVDAKDLSISH